MDSKMEKALNEQVVAEFDSAYLYLSMSAWADTHGLKGAANWLRIQFQEEQAHALHFFDYIKNRGGIVKLSGLETPGNAWTDILTLFEHVKTHEQEVTKRINTLYSLSLEVKDHATSTFLHWFVNEQVEEEKNVQEIIDQLRMIGKDGAGLYMLDKEMATRVFVQPTFGAVV
jgi:ferritin